jgi:hypothetical protein
LISKPVFSLYKLQKLLDFCITKMPFNLLLFPLNETQALLTKYLPQKFEFLTRA